MDSKPLNAPSGDSQVAPPPLWPRHHQSPKPTSMSRLWMYLSSSSEKGSIACDQHSY